MLHNIKKYIIKNIKRIVFCGVECIFAHADKINGTEFAKHACDTGFALNGICCQRCWFISLCLELNMTFLFILLFLFLGHGSEIFGDGDISPGHEFAVPQFPPGLQPALQGQGAQHTISTRQASAQVACHLTPCLWMYYRRVMRTFAALCLGTVGLQAQPPCLGGV